MPRKNNRNRSRMKGRRGGGGSRAVEALSLYTMNERQLATRSDRVSLRGKSFFTITASSPTSSGSIALLYSAFNNRMTQILKNFNYWRLAKVVLKCSTTVTGSAIGFFEDYSGEGGSIAVPTTVTGVTQLRSATLMLETVSQLQWNPHDSNRWFYVAVGSDTRFSCPASIFYASQSGSSTVTGELLYSIEAYGAVDATGNTVSEESASLGSDEFIEIPVTPSQSNSIQPNNSITGRVVSKVQIRK